MQAGIYWFDNGKRRVGSVDWNWSSSWPGFVDYA